VTILPEEKVFLSLKSLVQSIHRVVYCITCIATKSFNYYAIMLGANNEQCNGLSYDREKIHRVFMIWWTLDVKYELLQLIHLKKSCLTRKYTKTHTSPSWITHFVRMQMQENWWGLCLRERWFRVAINVLKCL